MSNISNYESAAKDIEQEKKMVAALKRLSIGQMMNFDPDLPTEDVDFIHRNDDHSEGSKSDSSSVSSRSPTRSSSSPIRRAGSLGRRFSLSSDRESINDDGDSVFYDAQDKDQVYDSSDPLLWVPANAHPEVDPEQFKIHVKVMVDELRENHLSRQNSLKRKSSLSRVTLPSEEEPKDDEQELQIRSQQNRYSNPSLRDLSTELERLSKMAGMDATDTVTLARTLSTTSLGMTDVERHAIDEMTSPPRSSPSPTPSPSPLREDNGAYEQESPTAKKGRASPYNQNQGYVPRHNEFELKRSRRTDYRKKHEIQPVTKQEKLAELRQNLTSDPVSVSHSLELGSGTYPRHTDDRVPRLPRGYVSRLAPRVLQQPPPVPTQKMHHHPQHHGQSRIRQEQRNGPLAGQFPQGTKHGSHRPHQIQGGTWNVGPRTPVPQPESVPQGINHPQHRPQLHPQLQHQLQQRPQHQHQSRPQHQFQSDPRQKHRHHQMQNNGPISRTRSEQDPRMRGFPQQNVLPRTRPHEFTYRKKSDMDGLVGKNDSPYAGMSSTHVPLRLNSRKVSPTEKLPVSTRPAPDSYDHSMRSSRDKYGNQVKARPRQAPPGHPQQTPYGPVFQKQPQGKIPPLVMQSPSVLPRRRDDHMKASSETRRKEGENLTPVPLDFQEKSRHLNQNLDLLRSEINEFKERLTKGDASDSENVIGRLYTPEPGNASISFDSGFQNISYEDSLGIEKEVLMELENNNEAKKSLESADGSELDTLNSVLLDLEHKNELLPHVPDVEEVAREEVAREEAAREEAARKEAAREEAAREEAAREEAAREEDKKPIDKKEKFTRENEMKSVPLVTAPIETNEIKDAKFDPDQMDEPAFTSLPTKDKEHKEKTAAPEALFGDDIPSDNKSSPDNSPKRQRSKKPFGELTNHSTTSLSSEDAPPEANKVKKKSSWKWLKDRSISFSSVESSKNEEVPVAGDVPRSLSNPEISPSKEAEAENEPTPKESSKENVITKLFKKKKQHTRSSSLSQAGESQVTVAYESDSESRPKKGIFKKSKTKSSKIKNQTTEMQRSISLAIKSPFTSKSQDTLLLDASESSDIVSRKSIDSVKSKKSVTEREKTPEKNEEPLTESDVKPKEIDDTQPKTTQDIQEQIKKSIKKSTKANEPITFTDSAFGFPLPPPSQSTVVMLDYRFPVHVERAIYRLSHLKLANPKRSLREQVLLSNFMYAYLNLVDHTLHLEQHMTTGEEESDFDETSDIGERVLV